MAHNEALSYDIVEGLLKPSTATRNEADVGNPNHWSMLLQLNDDGYPPMFNIFTDNHICKRLWDIPLLRIYDYFSGSQPAPDNRMQARSARQSLVMPDVRKNTLAKHADHRNWTTSTPYISFTSSPAALTKLARQRQSNGNRGPQFLVVIDPRYRFSNGLPILDFKEQMAAYSIGNPYSADYYKDHYLCLWEVTPAEVVGIWHWDDLQHDTNWYENSVLPAVQRHRSPPSNLTMDLESEFANLCIALNDFIDEM